MSNSPTERWLPFPGLNAAMDLKANNRLIIEIPASETLKSFQITIAKTHWSQVLGDASVLIRFAESLMNLRRRLTFHRLHTEVSELWNLKWNRPLSLFSPPALCSYDQTLPIADIGYICGNDMYFGKHRRKSNSEKASLQKAFAIALPK